MIHVFISDCEGPISKNDNAFEITSHFIPGGDRLFTIISRYDDVLAGVLKKPGYKAGDTLKLILPFLLAYDVTDSKMEQYSARNLVLIANVKETLQYVRSITNAYVVSTSYEHYIRAICRSLEFPCENAYCTKLKIDRYTISDKEKDKLKKIVEEIKRMSVFDVPPETKSFGDLLGNVQEMIHRLDEIFWEEIACMKSGEVYAEVSPMGGKEKAEAIRDVVRKLGLELADVMYVGDSITDEEAFGLVRENGGMAISFNGNQYAVESADLAILSESSIVTAVIADVFCRYGKKQVLNLVEKWSRETLNTGLVNHALVSRLYQLHPHELPKVKIITSRNMETLARESTDFRKKVRGEAIGRLG